MTTIRRYLQHALIDARISVSHFVRHIGATHAQLRDIYDGIAHLTYRQIDMAYQMIPIDVFDLRDMAGYNTAKYSCIGIYLQSLRISNSYTIDETAKKLKLTIPRYIDYEVGRKMISIITLNQLDKLYDVSMPVIYRILRDNHIDTDILYTGINIEWYQHLLARIYHTSYTYHELMRTYSMSRNEMIYKLRMLTLLIANKPWRLENGPSRVKLHIGG